MSANLWIKLASHGEPSGGKLWRARIPCKQNGGTSGTIASLHCGQRKVPGTEDYLGFGIELREAARHGHMVIICAHGPPLALHSIDVPISTCPYCTLEFQWPALLCLAALPSTPSAITVATAWVFLCEDKREARHSWCRNMSGRADA
jgi:hypothetical protein